MPGDARLQSLLDAFDEPVLVIEDGRISAANWPARSLLGRAIVGRDIRLALRHPQVLEMIEAGGHADIAVSWLAGVDRPWTIALRPLEGGGCVLRFMDRSPAIAAERMRVDFVANASHELRTPLSTISGFAETLAEPDLPQDIRTKFAGMIGQEAARMLRIIEDLMGLSRIEASRFIPPAERCDLNALARQAAGQVVPLTEKLSCPVDLQLEQEELTVPGDRAQLLQLMDNLLANAIRYGGSGVVLATGMDGERAFIRVSDTGPGIGAMHLPRLTERFYRVDDARSRDSGGTGLGLAIVKHIVERHRGTLDIRSAPGEGTSVTVTLPAA